MPGPWLQAARARTARRARFNDARARATTAGLPGTACSCTRCQHVCAILPCLCVCVCVSPSSLQRAATATTSVPGIDWEAYAKALPDIDIEAVRADYEKFQDTVPDVPYDAAADAARAAADREVFEDVAAYASGRISELAETAIEQEDHKLHDHYTVARLFQRFDGQFEKEWLEWRKVNLVGNLRTLSEVSETITPEQKREVVAAMANKLGVSPSSLGRSG